MKADTQFSVPRVLCPEERSNAKEVGNYQYTSALMRERLNLFFRTIISVNQLSMICVKNTNPAMLEQGRPVMVGQSDPLFVPTSSLMKTPTLSTDDLAQEDLLKSTKNEWKGNHNKIV